MLLMFGKIIGRAVAEVVLLPATVVKETEKAALEIEKTAEKKLK